ncbi:MAG: hypothetical protein AWU57_382 [Marinobacter sp. T13-3]|nr:MAG: hypothetical protein AWU57_382 [Marinobacter sp. T13-3]
MQVESVAIVIHKLSHSSHAYDNGMGLSVTAHDIIHHNDRSTLGPGRVFGINDQQQLLATLTEQVVAEPEILDTNVLVSTQETLMWYRPAGKTLVNMNGTDMRIPLPPLVFACHKGRLYIMAATGSGRPNADTALRECGLPNVNADGAWCDGGNKLPEQPRQSHIEDIERMFLESPFTHWWNTHPEGAEDMTAWFEALAKKPRYPMRSLNDANRTLGQWLKTLTTTN